MVCLWENLALVTAKSLPNSSIFYLFVPISLGVHAWMARCNSSLIFAYVAPFCPMGHGQQYRSSNVSPTLIYQTDWRITNHRRQKSPLSYTLLSFKTRIKWPLGWYRARQRFLALSWEERERNLSRRVLSWPQPQVFRGYFCNSYNFQGNVRAFRLTGLLRWQELTWFFQHFLQDWRWVPWPERNELRKTSHEMITSICRFRSSILLSL